MARDEHLMSLVVHFVSARVPVLVLEEWLNGQPSCSLFTGYSLDTVIRELVLLKNNSTGTFDPLTCHKQGTRVCGAIVWVAVHLYNNKHKPYLIGLLGLWILAPPAKMMFMQGTLSRRTYKAHGLD